MGVDNSCEVDGAILNGLLENRGNPGDMVLVPRSRDWPVWQARGVIDLLRGMCRINDHGILSLVVDNQIGVVVATAHPFCSC